jgi:UDP-glucose 4-epimerase
MKILLTGSSGFIGTHITKQLSKKHTIIPYDKTIGQDILDQKTLEQHMKGVDLVIHLAALLNQAESWEKSEAYFTTNVFGTYTVLTAAKNMHVKRVIYLSSAAVYADPLTPYGMSKKLGEELCKMFRDAMDITILRPFNLYGPGQNDAYNYVIHTFVKQLKNNAPIPIFGDGKQSRDFLFIDDFISLLEKILLLPPVAGPIDIGTGKDIHIRSLAQLLGKILEKEVTLTFLPKRIEPYRSKANKKHLQKLGITPSFISLEDGLRKLLQPSAQ